MDNHLFVHRTHTFLILSVSSNAVRMDGLRYKRGDKEQVEIVDCVLHMDRLKCQYYFHVRRMVYVEVEHGNRKVVEC